MLEKEVYSPILKNFQAQWQNLSRIKNKGLDGFKSVDILLTSSLEDRLIYYLPFKSNQVLVHYSDLKKRKLSTFQITYELCKSLVNGSFGKYSDLEKLDFGISLIFILLTKGKFALKQKLFSVSLQDPKKNISVYFYSKYIMELNAKQIIEMIVLIELLVQDLFISRDNDFNPSKSYIDSILEECRNFQYSNIWIKEEDSIKRLLGLISYEITSDMYDSSKITIDYINNVQAITNRSGLCHVLLSLFSEKSYFLHIIKSVLLTKWYFIFEPKYGQIGLKIKKPMFLEKTIPISPNFIPMTDESSQNGFQLFFGNVQNTGIEVVGIHPSLFYLIPGLYSGSQILLEGYPKPLSITAVENLPEPLVLTKSDEVLSLNFNFDVKTIDKIITLGGILVDPQLIEEFDPDIKIFDDWNYWFSRFKRITSRKNFQNISLINVKNMYSHFFKFNRDKNDISDLIKYCIENKLMLPHFFVPKWETITHNELKLILDKFIEEESIEQNIFILEYDESLIKLLKRGYTAFNIKEKKIKILNYSEFLIFLLKEYRSSLLNVINDKKNTDKVFNFQQLLSNHLDIRISPQNQLLGMVLTKTWGCSLIQNTPKRYGILNKASPKINKDNVFLQNSYPGEFIEKSLLRMKHDISIFRSPNFIFQAPNAQTTHFRPIDIETSLAILIKLGYYVDKDGNSLTSEKQVLSLISNDIILPKSMFKDIKRIYEFLDEELLTIFQDDLRFDIKTPQDLIGHYIIGCNPNSSIGSMGRVIGWVDNYLSKSCVIAHPLWHISKYSSCKNDEPDNYYIFEDLMLNYNVSLLPQQLNGLLGQPIFIKEKIGLEDIYHNSIDGLDSLTDEFHEEKLLKSNKEILKYLKSDHHGFAALMNIPFTSFNEIKPNFDYNMSLDKCERDYQSSSDDINKQMPLEITRKDFSSIMENIQIFEKFNNSNLDFIIILYCNYYLFPRFLAQLNLWLEQSIECPQCKFPYPYAIFKNCTNCGEELKLAYNKDPIINQYNSIKELLKKFPSKAINESFYYVKNQFKLLFPTNKNLNNN